MEMYPARRSWKCKDIKRPPQPCKGQCVVPDMPVVPVLDAPVVSVSVPETFSKMETIRKVFLMG